MMTTEVPYAADAEDSLTYDELEVSLWLLVVVQQRRLSNGIPDPGSPVTVLQGTRTGPCYNPVKVQLCLGTGEEPNA